MKRKIFTRLSNAILLLVCLNLFSGQANAQTYCSPTFINGCYNWSNLTISVNTLSWSLGTTDCTISDYTSMSTTLTAGVPYVMSVYSGYFTGCGVWIDLNSDGNFDEAGENMFHQYSAPASGYVTYTYTLTIPPCTPTGSYRMRVIAGWGTDCYDVSTNGYGSCGTTSYQYGNFDDFTINVVQATCDTPITLTASSITTTSAVFNWAAPPCSVGYQYILNTSAATPTGPGTPISATTYTATGLTPGTTYYLHLRNFCSDGDSSAWVEVPVTTLETCGAPVTPSVSSITSSTALFTWSAPGGYPVTDYQYTLNTTGIPPTSPGTPTTATSYEATGLAPSTTYYFYVRTICASGDSSEWELVSFTTAPPCDPPTSISVSGLTSTSAIISWMIPAGAPVGNYQYSLSSLLGAPTGPGIPISATSTSASGLTPATVYYFYVRTMCADGDSSAWVEFSFITPEPCDQPLAVAASSITYNSATINWTAPGGAPVTDYQYVLSTTATTPTGPGTATSGTTYNATGLSPVTTYYFYIRTMCTDGDSSSWELYSFTTEPVCGTPTILTNDDTYEGIHIIWSSVYEAVQYQYVLDMNPAPPTVPGTATTDTVYNMIGLAPNTTYYFHLSVQCTGGDAPWEAISFTTLHPVGISNVNGNETHNISVSPNPAKDFVNIAIDGNPSGNAYIQLTDMAGRVLETLPVTAITLKLDLSALPQGMYFIHYTDDLNNQTVKLVK